MIAGIQPEYQGKRRHLSDRPPENTVVENLDVRGGGRRADESKRLARQFWRCARLSGFAAGPLWAAITDKLLANRSRP